MQPNNLESYRKTGSTLKILSTDGKEPVEVKILNKSASYFEITFSRGIKVLFGILNRQLALLMLRGDIILGHCLWVAWI